MRVWVYVAAITLLCVGPLRATEILGNDPEPATSAAPTDPCAVSKPAPEYTDYCGYIRGRKVVERNYRAKVRVDFEFHKLWALRVVEPRSRHKGLEFLGRPYFENDDVQGKFDNLFMGFRSMRLRNLAYCECGGTLYSYRGGYVLSLREAEIVLGESID
jgi:hypothetical protein